MINNNTFGNAFGTSALSSNSDQFDSEAAAKSMMGLLPTESKEPKQSARSASSGNKAGTNPDGTKRRGPNSHRVQSMFDSITANRIPLDEAIKTHNVSVHVARQSKRFDPFPERGQIVIKTLTDDASGSKKTFIWRVPNA